MKLYHATKEENKQAILRDGLIAFFPAVYMTPDLVVAKRFGEVVFEIESNNLNPELLSSYREMLCDLWKTDDFYHYYSDIPPKLLKLIK